MFDLALALLALLLLERRRLLRLDRRLLRLSGAAVCQGQLS